MQRIEFELPRESEIFILSCTHFGSVMTHLGGIVKVINMIAAKPNRYWIHLGDWIEAITTDDKRYQHETTEQSIPHYQAAEAIRMFSKIKEKGICGLLGNHERKLHRVINFAKYICEGDEEGNKSLGIKYGTETARIIFTNEGKTLFRAFVTHGNKLFTSNAKDFEQGEANKRAALKLYLQNKMGDCSLMVCGHAHWLSVVPPSKRLYLVDGKEGVLQNYLSGDTTSDGYIDPDRRWYGCAGSFYKIYVDGVSSYNENYNPNNLGCLKVIVSEGKIVDVKEIVV